ncbi:MAG: YtxH domain-containing protein [Acidobacteriota bacterium]|nr:YtxH domain-containing protein [Acidobacteriota bacterium]
MFGRSRGTFRNYAFTFGFGVVAGAILGLLYAPITGKKMQKRVGEVTDQVIDRVDELQQKVRKIANA